MRRLRGILGFLVLGMATAPVLGDDPEPALIVELGGGQKLELVLIRAGTFTQGSPADEPGRGEDEPAREVVLSRDFYISRAPITRGQFTRFALETRFRSEAETGTSGGFGYDGETLAQAKEYTWKQPGFPQRDDHPVCLVTYADAVAFTNWARYKARRPCELPTEAQWEYACRAGTTTAFHHGEPGPDAIAWTKENAANGTRPVGQRRENPWGLVDMGGNVFEWCRDWYGPYEAGPVTDPLRTEPAGDKPRRVLRGGSWFREAHFARSAARYRNDPGSRNADNGFRVVVAIDLDPEEVTASLRPPRPIGQLAGSGPTSGRLSSPRLIDEPPVPMPAPASPPPARAEINWLLVLMLGLGGLGVVGVLVRLVKGGMAGSQAAAKALGGRAVTPGSPGFLALPRAEEIRTQAATDGFWIRDHRLPPGAILRYRCRLQGNWSEDVFSVGEGENGLFVYTGGSPTSISILDVTYPPTRLGSTYTPTTTLDDVHRPSSGSTTTHGLRHNDPPHRSSGYPSAY